MQKTGNSLAVGWLGLRASTAGGTGSIPSRGTKILHAAWRSKKKKTQKSRKNNYQAREVTAAKTVYQ